jgi:autotransporter strand-loop-strand O-heptosyltransferase
MKIVNVTPGLIPIPPNGWGAVEKIIWETHNALLKLGHTSKIQYLDEVVDYDVVHIHVANLALMAYERGIPYYFTMHDHHAYLYGKDSHAYKENLEAIKKAKKAFVPAKYLVDYFEGIPEYFSHGVNVEYFTPKSFKEHRLLCVANNGFIHDQSEDRKGFGHAIQIAKHFNLPITIAGPKNNQTYFEKFPSDYDKLDILYDLTEDQLKDLYKSHSIFLHFSLLEAGHPNLTLLEAMASGLPIVGTYEKKSDLSGMLVVNRYLDEGISAVSMLLDPIIYLQYSKKARQQAVDLSWDNRVKELLKKYTMSLKDQLISGYNNTKILRTPSKEDTPKFNINFIEGALFEVVGGPDREYTVQFIDKKTGQTIHQDKIKKNHWTRTSIKYYKDWSIFVDDGINSYEYNMDLKDKRVYIALDSKALGDTLAWFSSVEEFRKKHNCKVICSTFWNHFFKDEYPEIEFVKPGETVHNLYAMYTIGWFYKNEDEFDFNKVPYDFRNQSLQKTASDILGLEFKEVKPRLKLNKDIQKECLVSIAIHGTAQTKYWNNPTGWQELVDYIKSKGYRVCLLSKEEDGYMGNKHPKGVEHVFNNDIESVIQTLQKSVLFIGISSGLSWLSWAVGTNTCLISGFTDPKTEFEDCVRISPEEHICQGCFNTDRLDAGDWNWCPRHKNTDRQFECTKTISASKVIDRISQYL